MGLSNEERMMKVYSAVHKLTELVRDRPGVDGELKRLIGKLPSALLSDQSNGSFWLLGGEAAGLSRKCDPTGLLGGALVCSGEELMEDGQNDWAADPKRVGVYERRVLPDRPVFWRFRARIDPKAVDLGITLDSNLDLEYGDVEREVTMRPNARIYVYGAQLIRGYDTETERYCLEDSCYRPGGWVRIEDWRRA